MHEELTAERLRSLLDYNQESGVFTWKCKVGPVAAGSIAGTPHKEYVNIQIDGRQYKAHRLAALWMTGSWPEAEIDHRNGDGCDNRWRNLRPSRRGPNMQNKRKAHRNSKTGLLGATPCFGKFRARIWVDGKNLSLGLFDTAEEAHDAYVAAKRRLHEGNTL